LKSDLQFLIGLTVIYVAVAFLMLSGCSIVPDHSRSVAEVNEQAW
jgi:hypothetical protein